MKKTIHALVILLLNTISLFGILYGREAFLNRITKTTNPDASSYQPADQSNEYYFSRTSTDRNMQNRLLTESFDTSNHEDNSEDLPDNYLMRIPEDTATTNDPKSISIPRDTDEKVGFFPTGFAIFTGIGREERTSKPTQKDNVPRPIFSREDDDNSSLHDPKPTAIASVVEDSNGINGELFDGTHKEDDDSPEIHTPITRPQAFIPVFPDEFDDIKNNSEYADVFEPIFDEDYDQDNTQKWSGIFVPVFGTLSPTQPPTLSPTGDFSLSPTPSPSEESVLAPSQQPSSQVQETGRPSSSPTISLAPTEFTPLFTFAPTLLEAPTAAPVQAILTNAPTVSTPVFTPLPTDEPDVPTLLPTSQTTSVMPVNVSPPPSSSNSPTEPFSDFPSSLPDELLPTLTPTESLPLFTFSPTAAESELTQSPVSPQPFSSSSPSIVVTSLSDAPSIFPSTTPQQETTVPSRAPALSDLPSSVPTVTASPTSTPLPTVAIFPSLSPSQTLSPSESPTTIESLEPSSEPSYLPSNNPTLLPSNEPTLLPSHLPSFVPSQAPSTKPSLTPSFAPSIAPSVSPSVVPSALSSPQPTNTVSENAELNRRSAPLNNEELWSSSGNILSTVEATYFASLLLLFLFF